MLQSGAQEESFKRAVKQVGFSPGSSGLGGFGSKSKLLHRVPHGKGCSTRRRGVHALLPAQLKRHTLFDILRVLGIA